MAAEPSPEQKSLEIRLAQLEDKLSKIQITEEELKAYRKVSSLLGLGAGGTVSIPPVGVANCSAYLRCDIVMHGCRMYQQGVAFPLFGEGGSPATGFGSLGS